MEYWSHSFFAPRAPSKATQSSSPKATKTVVFYILPTPRRIRLQIGVASCSEYIVRVSTRPLCFPLSFFVLYQFRRGLFVLFSNSQIPQTATLLCRHKMVLDLSFFRRLCFCNNLKHLVALIFLGLQVDFLHRQLSFSLFSSLQSISLRRCSSRSNETISKSSLI